MQAGDGPIAGRSGYRPGLDGIRALAVVAVLLFHLDRLEGGFLGVDLFFALSGWLITWRLLNEADRNGRIDIGGFWSARIRRIVPASMLVLLAIAVVWPLAGIDVPSLRRDIAFATVWASNWGTITGGGNYWARFGELSPVTHFWSLAVEEQFYLFWPVVVVGVVWYVRRHRLGVAVASVLGAVGSVVLMNVIFDPVDPTAAYMNTFARLHTLLIGAALGALTTVGTDGTLRGGSIARRLAPIAAVIVVVIMLTASDEATWMFRWGFPVFAVAAATVVVAVADGMAQPVLAAIPMRWLGIRSYGLYLWHWPVFLLLTTTRLNLSDGAVPRALLDVVRVAVAIALAAASFRFVETPIRERRVLVGRQAPMAAVASVAVVALAAVFLIPSDSNPPESSVVTLPPRSTTVPTTVAPATPAPSDSTAGSASTEPVTQEPEPAAIDPGPLRVLVTGDSTGVELSAALIDHAATVPERLVVGAATFGGCGLSAAPDGRLHEFTAADGERELVDLVDCVTLWDAVPGRVIDEAIDVVLVDIGPWDCVDMHLADGRVVSVGDATGEQLVAERYVRFVEQVRAAGATVVWIRPADTHIGWGAFEDPLNEPARWTALRAIIDGLDVAQIDLPVWLDGNDLTGPEGRPDGVHLAPDVNERFVAEAVAPTLEQLRVR